MAGGDREQERLAEERHLVQPALAGRQAVVFPAAECWLSSAEFDLK
jgi:hypothetical protein